MKECIVTIRGESGLHMRPAMMIVEASSRFKSDIFLSKKDIKADAKSIMKVTMLAAEENDKIKIIAEGPDEQKAIETLKELFTNNFKYILDIKS